MTVLLDLNVVLDAILGREPWRVRPNSPDMGRFREEIQNAYFGRAPRTETGAIRTRYDGAEAKGASGGGYAAGPGVDWRRRAEDGGGRSTSGRRGGRAMWSPAISRQAVTFRL